VKIFSICLYLAGICATLQKYKKIKSLPIISDKLFALVKVVLPPLLKKADKSNGLQAIDKVCSI